jgi:hypothetical protein
LGGASIAGYFDLITGTSTGGIIAIGLAAGKTASEVAELYLRHGQSIFPRPSAVGVFRPAFRPNRLSDLLQEIVGDRTLQDATVRLCIPSCEARFGDVNIFETPHHPDFKLDWQVPMADAALATSAAPTFLPVHLFNEFFYVDGGLWANNPAMVGLVDALSCFALDPHRVSILSVGPGAKAPSLRRRHLSWGGFIAWMLDNSLIESFMHYSGLNADGQAGLLVGRQRVLRIVGQGDAASVGMTDFAGARDHCFPAGEAAANALADSSLEPFFADRAERPTFYHGRNAGTDPPTWA